MRISWDVLSNFKCFYVVWSKEIGAALKLGHSFTPVFSNVEDLNKNNNTSSTDIHQNITSEGDNTAMMK